MARLDTAPVLAEAADVLSQQFQRQLRRLAKLIAPHADALDRRFTAQLKREKLDARQQSALLSITVGAAIRGKSGPAPLSKFFEQVSYNGRRLAKLNLTPGAILHSLQVYDGLLNQFLGGLPPEDQAALKWVQEQLQFCVVLTLNNAYYQVREAETEAFFELFRAETDAGTLKELLERSLGTLARFCKADRACLYLQDETVGAWVPMAVLGGDAAAQVKEPSKKLGVACCVPASKAKDLILLKSWRGKVKTIWSVPLALGGRVYGVIQLGFDRDYAWFPREEQLLANAAERCMAVAEKRQLIEHLAASEAQVKRLAAHMLQVEEMERRRISRELHDEAGQSLLYVRLQIEMVEAALASEKPELSEQLKTIRQSTERTIVEIRRLIAALSPAVLEQLGLAPALRQLVMRFRQVYPAKVKFTANLAEELPKKLDVIVYRLVQECFNNISKHSEASTVNISVVSADRQLRLVVEDDGKGFEVSEAFARRDSFGLSGMRERVTLLGGSFEVDSRQAAGKNTRGDSVSTREKASKKQRPGTRISIRLPISGAEEPVEAASRG